MCKPAIDPYPWRNHAQLGGGSVAERLMSTLAYGWVERCSGVAGCGLILHQNISTAGYFISVIYTNVKCWNVYVCFRLLFEGLCILV